MICLISLHIRRKVWGLSLCISLFHKFHLNIDISDFKKLPVYETKSASSAQFRDVRIIMAGS